MNAFGKPRTDLKMEPSLSLLS